MPSLKLKSRIETEMVSEWNVLTHFNMKKTPLHFVRICVHTSPEILLRW